MPIPKALPQSKVIVNGRPAVDMGRRPKVAKPWRPEHADKPPLGQDWKMQAGDE